MAGPAVPTLAVFTKNRTNPAYDAARLGAERTAARLGARVVHYVPDTPDDVAQQIALVDRAIADRPDAFLFVPVHATAMDDSVRKLNATGVPVINYLNRLTASEFVAFVGSDDYRLGYDIADYLFRHLDGRGEIVIIEGAAAAVTNRERMCGFHDAVRAHPGIRVAASRPGDYQREPAVRAMRELIAALPRIDGVIAAADVMALGIIDVLATARQRVPVVSVNAIPEAIAALKAGTLLATADFNPMKIASIATEAAVRSLRGDAVPREILLPVEVVDASNFSAWDKPFSERADPRWADVVSGSA
ncbi:MAG: sugar ABC transporter substrate-binding protein [Betaproteobacteria bacterium]|nr:sugar ABC transporter substrate-binding protein [Betaproteobacteria bacterium]